MLLLLLLLLTRRRQMEKEIGKIGLKEDDAYNGAR